MFNVKCIYTSSYALLLNLTDNTTSHTSSYAMVSNLTDNTTCHTSSYALVSNLTDNTTCHTSSYALLLNLTDNTTCHTSSYDLVLCWNICFRSTMLSCRNNKSICKWQSSLCTVCFLYPWMIEPEITCQKHYKTVSCALVFMFHSEAWYITWKEKKISELLWSFVLFRFD